MSSRAFRRAPISRRSFLKTSALTAGTLTLPLAAPFRARAADPLKPVTMTLDWLYEGTNVGFLVAHEQGFFREAGLDVAVSSGKGSGSTAQLVASKATQIGFSDGYVVGNGIAKGMAIKTVGSIFRRGPATIMVLAEILHQGSEGPRRQNRRHEREQRGVPAMARFRQGCRH